MQCCCCFCFTPWRKAGSISARGWEGCVNGVTVLAVELVVVTTSLVGIFRFLVEVVYRSGTGSCICFEWWFGPVTMPPLELALVFSFWVLVLLPSGDGGEDDVLENDSLVLAVARDRAVLSSLWGITKDFDVA